MKAKRIYLLLLSSMFLSLSFAQNAKLRQADKEYRDFAYVKTSEILLEVANKGYKSVDLFQKLGNSFYFRNRMEEAAKWYGELMQLTEDVDREYMFRYAQSLKAIKNYDESDRWMKKFYEADKADLRGKAFASNVDYLSTIEKLSDDFTVNNMSINTELSEFGTVQYKNLLVFSSTRGGGKEYQWNEQPFLNLYQAVKQPDGSYIHVEEFDESLNSKFHESTPTFTSDDRTIYFTRNSYVNNRLKKDEGGTVRLKVFRSTLDDEGNWSDPESLIINNDAYSVANPTINAAGTKLYYASDMPGTLGASDIFMSEIDKDGNVGKPVNLGSVINTEAKETFPYINAEGDLFYSSNGKAGLGGFDVYVVRGFEKKMENNEALGTQNLGKPVNSSKDDFGYYENNGTREGFFSSNRDGGKGDDDIYSFTIPECEQTVEGTVKDKKTLELLADATVILFDKEGKELQRMTTKVDGEYKFNIECDKEFLVRGEKELYISDEKRFLTPRTSQELVVELLLDKDEVAIAEATNLRDALDLNPIYFDLDKSNIRPDAEIELQKVISVLKKYPKINLDVRSHTDSRASDTYNQALSERRNKSTIKYIVEVGGIDAGRISGKGYGESQLLNKCSNGVDCNEEEHQLNRRSDFIIKEM
ncbi:Outer membrane protein OmpA [Flavobacteriaceae bacterium MAR_2010_188]|nr:Outer membrane protein OmpA [Flavobacteriaceae bacterium MAR_2010_188]